MRVLFVGNSYTLYHDVPAQVAALTGLEVEASVEGGADWKRHREVLGTPDRIARGFDVVVLQAKSTDPLLARHAFFRHGGALAGLARRSGAKVLLYQTWAWAADHRVYRDPWSKRSPEGWSRAVREAYARLALATDAEVAPVGDAWLRALAAHPGLDLHAEDRHHAAFVGAHLAALVLARALTRRDPRTFSYSPAELEAAVVVGLREIAATT
ncbi:MAG: hypothetical protein H6721_09870 [Sandaracinus sp.]|nr:hypothetical protein [Sandaracinus sp.]MCB9616039.1 hypothetical protein [Sandaracinus sp.]MCB9632422.1 hypothetical protein [Sandaracinus sp.]